MCLRLRRPSYDHAERISLLRSSFLSIFLSILDWRYEGRKTEGLTVGGTDKKTAGAANDRVQKHVGSTRTRAESGRGTTRNHAGARPMSLKGGP